MNVLLRPLFILCSALFVLHQLTQWGMNTHIPWADAYLDNLVAMPVVLHLWLAEQRLLFKKGENFELPASRIIVATAYILLITELIFPLLSSRFTADAWDVLYTAAGALLYYFSAKRYRLQAAKKAGT